MDGFDLEGYIAKYGSYARVQRLVFIAEHAKECVELRKAALKMALAELEGGPATGTYRTVCAQATPLLGDGVAKLDVASASEAAAVQTLDRLEADLASSKASMVKETTRMALNELGEFQMRRGDFTQALQHFTRARDYCSSNKHVIEMCMHVIVAAVHAKQLLHVTNYASKAEASMPRRAATTPSPVGSGAAAGDAAADVVLVSKLRAAAALAHLDAGSYSAAAHKFLQVNASIGGTFADVVHVEDVALYAVLCAIASFDRQQLKEKLLDSLPFRKVLEARPVARDVLQSFYASDFTKCMAQLEKLKPALLLDVHLRAHVHALFEQARRRGIVQYCLPYMTVSLPKMAKVFAVTTGELEEEMAGLIAGGLISARIDAQSQTIVRCDADSRAEAYGRALALGERVLQESHAMLFRIALQRGDFEVRGAPGRGRGGDGDGGGGWPKGAQGEGADGGAGLGGAFWGEGVGGGGGGGGGGSDRTPPASPAPARAAHDA